MARAMIVEQSEFGRLAGLKIVVRHGSCSDPLLKRGLAFMTARMLLRGAGGLGFLKLSVELERMGGFLSAHSDEEFTYVEGSVLAENLESFSRLARMVLESPDFDAEELQRARLKVEGEIRSAFEDPRTLALLAAKKELFGGTPLETLNRGEIASLACITSDDLRCGWDLHYLDGALVIGLASPLDGSYAADLISAGWEGFRPGGAAGEILPRPRFQAARAVVVEREGMSTTPFYLVAPGIRDDDPDACTGDLANFCFGGDFTSRLMRSLRSEHGWTYGVQSGFEQILSNRGTASLFSVYAYPSATHFGESLSETLRLYREFVQKGLSPEEFEFARESLGLSHVFEWETASKRLDGRIRMELSGRRFESVDEYRARLAALDLGKVNSVIASRFQEMPPLLIAVGDPEKLVPAIDVAGRFESIEITRIHP